MSVSDRRGIGWGRRVGRDNVLSMFVKICGVTTAEDALLAAGLGADAVGMIFAASPRRIGAGTAHDIVRRLPPEVLSVGVFRNERRERVVEVANTIGLRAVQLHGTERPEDVRWIGERVPAVIKAFSVGDPALRAAVAGTADYGPHRLLIDAPAPGRGETFDWSLLDRLVAGRPFILAGGLTPENVGRAIELVGPWGVDVASGVEASPGHKDPARVRRFLAAVRAAAPDRSDAAALDDIGFDGDGSDELPVDALAVDASRDRPFNWEEDA